MNVHPVPFEEGRFVVFSTRNPDTAYLVDLQYKEEPWMRARPFCGCVRCLGHHEVCAHIFETVRFERERLKL